MPTKQGHFANGINAMTLLRSGPGYLYKWVVYTIYLYEALAFKFGFSIIWYYT